MTEVKESHTKGPWIFRNDYYNTDILTTDGKRRIGYYVAASGFGLDAEGEANGHLMAAAPELLDACEAAFDFFNKMGCGEFGLGQKLMNAISKAKND